MILELHDGSLTVKVESELNVSYAFYLHSKEGIEKKFYSDKNYVTFKKNIIDGTYKVTIFRRLFDQTVVSDNIAILVKNGNVILEKILKESDQYKISLYDLGAKITFIVFNGSGTTKSTPAFGLRFLLSKGFNVITCAQNLNQYQGLSFEDFSEIIGPWLNDKKVFLYGSSLGGYCAIYYAGAVNGVAISAAPRNSAHPVMISQFSNKFESSSFCHKDIIENRISEKAIYVMIDPHVKEDVFYLKHFVLPAYPNTTIIPVAYAGHEVLYHINRVKKLSLIIDRIVRDDIDDSIIINEASEFTYFGQALESYKNMLRLLDKIDSLDTTHTVIVKKLQWLKADIKKRVILK